MLFTIKKSQFVVVGSYAFHCKAYVCFCWFLCCFTIKTMFCRWFLCFSNNKNQCVVVGSYAFLNITNALSLVPVLFTFKTNASSFVPMHFFIKPMRFCCFVCFSHQNQCFLVGSYAFHCEAFFLIGSYALHNKTNAFSLVPMLFTIKPMFFSVVPMLFYIKTHASSLVPLLFTIKHAFSLVPMIFARKPLLVRLFAYVLK